MKTKTVSLLIIYALMCTGISYAYIDPGTGGIIIRPLGTLILGILGVIGAFFATFIINPIKNFLKKIAHEKKK